jgi:uncharacterized membrane protein
VNTYLWLKLIHIISAIVAVGANVTYLVWLNIAGSGDGRDTKILQGIQTLDKRIANPAYVVLPLTGVLMVLDADLGFTTFWILAAIILYVVMGAVGGGLFAPALRRQAELAAQGADETAYAAASKRTRLMGLLTMVPVAAILYLMVMKPTP